MKVWCGASVAMASSAAVSAVPAAAQEPALHRVTYTVTADAPAVTDIYYRDVDPPNWAAYSHNPYQFSPKAQAHIGADSSWVLEVMMTDPQRWAMVTATTGNFGGTPTLRCELAVDGVIVAADSGPKGALCSLRHW